MKKLTLNNNVASTLPENLNIVCVEGIECVCTDGTARQLEGWDDIEIEDMSRSEFFDLPDFIKGRFEADYEDARELADKIGNEK